MKYKATPSETTDQPQAQSPAPTGTDFFQDLYGKSGVRPPLGRGITREQAAALGMKTDETIHPK
jgi:hypothetical protein